MNTVKVIDSIPGAGKTEWMITEINNNIESKVIYITPFLEEVDRIKKSCPTKNFVSPDEKIMNSKNRHLKYLISKGKNIVSTHALFQNADLELLELLKSQDYTLCLDEVMSVVEPVAVSKRDMTEILDRYAHVDDKTNELVWDDMEYTGNHLWVKNMSLTSKLTVVRGVVLLWSFPHSVFESFIDTYILTYLFDAQIQKSYYEYYDIKFDKYSIDRVDGISVLVRYGESKFEYKLRSNVSKLLNIYDGGLNNIGNDKTALSKSWFESHKGQLLMERLKNNVYGYFKNTTKTKSNFNGWCTFKDFKPDISGKGYAKGHISLNMRASNDYAHKTAMAYISNRFLNPFVAEMFRAKGILIDQDQWALSELLQWLYRGCIRKREEMNIYIPSKRMRDLLKDWMI